MVGQSSIAVIIAAYQAENTIARAIRSALAEPEVGEVVVVDDASGDETVEAALAAGEGDPRLDVVRQTENAGPARARNRGIAHSTMPFLAVLDADDALLPGRFRLLMKDAAGWDFCADNVWFVPDETYFDRLPQVPDTVPESIDVTLADFIEGNIPRRNRLRAELGFLKPVYRREFIEAHAISYMEDCRLGEDFLFYAEALAQGARYWLYPHCGYAALHRENSLSGLHRTKDLRALATQSKAFLQRRALPPIENQLMNEHLNSTLTKLRHREVLDAKADRGLLAALSMIAHHPAAGLAILHDKLAPSPPPPQDGPRRLISDRQFTEWRKAERHA